MTDASTDTVLGLRVGDELPSFTRKVGLDIFNRYAAVNDEFVPIHMDDEAGRAAGYAAAFGMGNLSTAYLLNLLRAWVGEEGTIRSLGCQFRGAVLNGSTVTAHGRITGIRSQDGEVVVDLDVWTEDGEGTRLTPGTASVSPAP